MFIYLSKKIAIPQGIRVNRVSWNADQGWIGCGGASGLLKVLKLEAKSKSKRKGGTGSPELNASEGGGAAAGGGDPSGNLSMNKTLDGHEGNINVVCWNDPYRKLTSADERGKIIVWNLRKDEWQEEMENNRNQSFVTDMKWTTDGQKIGIVYEDGGVIVGSVDGNRLWGKDLDAQLTIIEWSPDGRNILFGTKTSEVHLYDTIGNFITKLQIFASTPESGARLVSVQWYSGINGYFEANCPTLAIAFDSGRIQIMRDDTDDNPTLIDTGMTIVCTQWNSFGSVLAVAGTKNNLTSSEEASPMVQFYNPNGKHLRTMRVPGKQISSISWEGGSLRLALAVDSFIYFANIRPDYEWGYFSSTIVYSFNKPDRAENCVCFWDISTDERHIKYVKMLISIRACGEHCVFATKTDDGSGQFILILCNAIGSPVDSKYIDVEPVYMTMTNTHIIVGSQDNIYVWQYKLPGAKVTGFPSSTAGAKGQQTASAALAAAAMQKKGRERLFHIDESADAVNMGEPNPRNFNRNPTTDPISAIVASKSSLIVSRASGILLRFSLPHLSLENKYIVRCRPQSLSLNCDSSKLSIVDINGILTILDLEARVKPSDSSSSVASSLLSAGRSTQNIGVVLDFERKDVWDFIWSDDNPDLFACMEKGRMYVFRSLLPEEPVNSSGFLCTFSDLCIKAVLLDDIMIDPENPDKDQIVEFETKTLRDARELIASTPINEASQFIEDNSHPRLWRLLAEGALEQLNFLVAEKSFVRCSDYQGIQFVKRLKLLPDKLKQKAEVSTYFRRFDEAENIYLQQDLKELAVELRTRLGDWFRVVQLIQSGAGDDSQLAIAYQNIGDYYADRQKWQKAYKFYVKSKNLKQQANCAYIMDDYEALSSLIESVPTGTDWLSSLGEKFQSVGMCNEAVQSFLKAENPKAAIDCCVLLNQWDTAVSLAEKHKIPNIEGLMTKYASYLLSKEKLFQAVELYRKANRHIEAAKLLQQIANEDGKTRVNPVRVKKLYVMAALEVEKYKEKMLNTENAAASTDATLSTLLTHDSAIGSDSALESPWHGAEAYHLYLMSQRLLYQGNVEAAMIAALRLIDYEDVLDTKEIYSLIALTSFYNKFFGQCSNAFIKLESLSSDEPSGSSSSAVGKSASAGMATPRAPEGKPSSLISSEGVNVDKLRDQYKSLALNIFIRFSPTDPEVNSFKCPNQSCEGQTPLYEWSNRCDDCNRWIPFCMASGRSLVNATAGEVYTCKSCKHKAFERDLRRLNAQNCPLCHSSLKI